MLKQGSFAHGTIARIELPFVRLVTVSTVFFVHKNGGGKRKIEAADAGAGAGALAILIIDVNLYPY